MTGNMGNENVRRGSGWRIAAWGAAALILLLPLVAMQFTGEVNWSGSDFVFAGVLLFSSLGAYEIAARKTGDAVYRAGVSLAIAATFLLIWGNAALHITDSEADAMYLGVAVIGVIGVIIALFRPSGGALAMLAAALGLVVVCVIALVAGMVPNYYASAFEVIGITGFYVTLYAGAAWLLRQAGRGQSPARAGSEG